MAWADDKLTVATQTADDVDLMNFKEKSATILSSDAYVNGKQAYKDSVDQVLSDLEQFITLGGTFEISDDGTVTFEDGAGTVIGESDIVADPEGNTYTEQTDGSVIVAGEDGTETTFTQDDDGEWVANTGELDPEIISVLDKLDNGDEVSNWEMQSDGTAHSKGGLIFEKVSGKWTQIKGHDVTVKTKATEDQLKFIDNATNKEEPDIVDEMEEEMDSLTTDKPTGTIETQGEKTMIAKDGQWVELVATEVTTDIISNIISSGSIDGASGEIAAHIGKLDRFNYSDYSEDELSDMLDNSEIKSAILDKTGGWGVKGGNGANGNNSGSRAEFGKSSTGYVTHDGGLWKVSGTPTDVDYKGNGRPDGDTKKVAKNHYGQYLTVVNVETGEELRVYQLMDADKNDSNNDIDKGSNYIYA
jgi:hypothetical protein